MQTWTVGQLKVMYHPGLQFSRLPFTMSQQRLGSATDSVTLSMEMI
jgi:hypothetical protein